MLPCTTDVALRWGIDGAPTAFFTFFLNISLLINTKRDNKELFVLNSSEHSGTTVLEIACNTSEQLELS